MTESEIYHPSWLLYNNINSSSYIDKDDIISFLMDTDITSYDFSPPLPLSEGTSNVSFPCESPESLFHEDYMDQLPVLVDELDFSLPTNDLTCDLQELLNMKYDESLQYSQLSLLETELGGWSQSRSLSQNSSDIALDMSSFQSSIVLPTQDMEIDHQIGIIHLLMAYGEAKGNKQEELAMVIAKRIIEKVSPISDNIMARLLYYVFHDLDNQSANLRQECLKNFYSALKAFNQILPNGKVAHFAANKAILDAMPCGTEVINIFDFDICEGIQWSSMIEALGHERREVRITSIRPIEDDERCTSHMRWSFEETKRRLLDHARLYGLKLKVEEKELNDLVIEMENLKKHNTKKQWFAFNCMVALPHMGRIRRRKDVFEFLTLAKNFLQHATRCCASDKGIITLGDGDAWEKIVNTCSYNEFLEANMVHYQALFESIEVNFPTQFVDARTTIEYLFVAPFVSSRVWDLRWEEKNKFGDIHKFGFDLEGCELSKESLMEAKEVIREGNSLYGARIEGGYNNEMVMDWRGVQLVKVSCWRC